MSAYFVYLLHCSDNTFYTGVTTDISRRLAEHNGVAKGAKYTKTRQPVRLVYAETCADRSSAQRREHLLRTLPRSKKAALADGWSETAFTPAPITGEPGVIA